MEQYYGGAIPWVKSGELRESTILATEESVTDLALSETPVKLVPRGSLLVAMYGATVGRIAELGIDATTNQAVCHIVPDPKVADRRYLYYALQAKVPEWIGRRVGGAQPNISQGIIRETKISLPPLEEQKRIAAILDKADALRRKRAQALQLTDQFLQSLFLDMFGDPVTNQKGFPVVELEAVCTRVTDGTHQPPKWAESGLPFLFVSNIKPDGIDFTTQKLISEGTWKELTARCPIEKGDVLYTTVGSYGNAALVCTDRRFAFQRHIAHIKPNHEKIRPEFLAAMMKSPGIRKQADQQVRGIAQKTLNLRELKKFIVFNPNFDAQDEFLAALGGIQRAMTNQRKAMSDVEGLCGSLGARAFQGEL